MNLEKEILELLRREGPATVYRIAKAFGLTYGAAQWYIGKLQQLGFIYTVKIGSKRYVALRDHDLLQKVTVEDAVNELTQALASHGIEPKTALREALERLEAKAPHLAEALRLIVQIR
jgi:DNA-binding Lrp family transcriptional regulator